MSKEFFSELNSFTEGIWQDSGAWPDLISGMRQAMKIEGKNSAYGQEFSRWALLPRLCCESIAEVPEGIIDLTAAWLLLYAAADLMDAVQDQDDEESWWGEIGVGGALGVASGLYFSSSLTLTRLDEKTRLADNALITADFYRGFMQMCSGQLCDILSENLSLEEYWQIAAAKSGAFFGSGCRAAARLASADQNIQQAFYSFGTEIGIMIQIRDDLDDYRVLKEFEHTNHEFEFLGSLPLVYAIDVLPAAESARLAALSRESSVNKAVLVELIKTIDNCGAGIYVLAELNRHGVNALAALENINPQEPAGSELRGIINQLMGAMD